MVARVLVNESDELAIKFSNNFDVLVLVLVLVPLQEWQCYKIFFLKTKSGWGGGEEGGGKEIAFLSCASGRATCSKLCCSSNRYCAFLNMYPVIMTLYISCARFSAT